jgi:hypothetical protein
MQIPRSASARLIRPAIAWLGSAALIIFAVAWVWHVGHRGLFLMDHSIVFDGGYRVLNGQVPYKDIYMAYLPGTLWVQAFFFWLYGVDFSAMVLPAAIFNGIGVAVVIRITLLLFPRRIVAAWAGGSLTALWFQAPFGSLQHEQVAFTFAMLALWTLLENWPSTVAGSVARLLAGLFTFAAVLCKQNAGVLFVPVAGGMIAFQFMPAVRRTLAAWSVFAAGLIAGLCAFLVWLALYSDFHQFVLHALTIPAKLGSQRLSTNLVSTAMTVVFLHSRPEIVYLAIWALLVAAVAFLGRASAQDVAVRRLRLASFLTIAVLFYNGLFSCTSLNQVENCMPFLGLAFGLTMAISFQLFYGRQVYIGSGLSPAADLRLGRRSIQTVLVIMAVLVFSVLAKYGWETDNTRMVQEFTDQTTFRDKLQVDRASRVVWGNPTYLGEQLLQREDFENLAHWLLQKNENFFVFPDATILYGLTGRISPQPLLYFLEGHSYTKKEAGSIDREMLASLQKNNVNIFIQEEDSVLSTQNTLHDFPLTYQWINTFHVVQHFGPFQVSERN